MNRREFLAGTASTVALGAAGCKNAFERPINILPSKGPVPGENLSDGYRHDIVNDTFESIRPEDNYDKSDLAGKIALTEKLLANNSQIVDSRSYEALNGTLKFLEDYPTQYNITGAGATPTASTKSSVAVLKAYISKVTVAEPEASAVEKVGAKQSNDRSR